jgi:hypothetical protein
MGQKVAIMMGSPGRDLDLGYSKVTGLLRRLVIIARLVPAKSLTVLDAECLPPPHCAENR